MPPKSEFHPANYGMTDEIDQLKALKAEERENLSTGYVSFNSLEEARLHQRAYKNGELDKIKPLKGQRRKFNEAQILDMLHSGDPVQVIADRNNTTQSTIFNYRKAYRNK